MGRPDYEDSIAGGDRSSDVPDTGATLGALTGSGGVNLSTVLGTLTENDNAKA